MFNTKLTKTTQKMSLRDLKKQHVSIFHIPVTEQGAQNH